MPDNAKAIKVKPIRAKAANAKGYGHARRWAKEVRHLLARATFGLTPEELAPYVEMSYKEVLAKLVEPEKIDNSALDKLLAEQVFDFTNPDDIKRWWLFRMMFTARPLEEKMTLFWHGHFATADFKVRNPYAMYVQNCTMRKLAFGRFDDLLLAMSKDPAMILWLDNQQNRKNKPNENYAREVMELFTMGIGNYTEQDVKEAARAFTGWQTKPDGFHFNSGQHDSGIKTVLGESGNFDGGDVITILARQKATGRFLARKLLRYFALDKPNENYVNEIAAVYESSDHNIGAMVRAIFSSKQFASPACYHSLIKSPCEYVIGTLKTFQITQVDFETPRLMAAMGQNLFNPPSVKGWDGGETWIASDTMMERFNFATRLISQKFDYLEKYSSPAKIAEEQGLNTPAETVDYFLSLLVDGDAPPSTRERLITYVASDFTPPGAAKNKSEKVRDARLRGLVHLIMTLPTYQLN
jgi:uncharacterized protein (DUF1800 family)